MKLYKYRKFNENNLATLESNLIWLSSTNQFNDVFDGNFRNSYVYTEDDHADLLSIEIGRPIQIPHHQLTAPFNDGDRAIQDHILTNLSELRKSIHDIGIFCTSEISDSLLPWSHYADNHQGFCIEYDANIEAPEIFAWPVNYSTQYPEVTYTEYKLILPKVLRNILTTKSSEWSYEREWRLIDLDATNKLVRSPFPISSVILGARATESDIDKIAEIVKHKNIPLRYAKPSSHEFKLKICPTPMP